MRDHEFIREQVPMTKESVRFTAIGLLALHRAQRFLDVGAGTGSVAVTAKTWFPSLEVVAIERKGEALALTQKNAEAAGVALTLIEGTAPLAPQVSSSEAHEAHGALEKPFDAIFVGGTGGKLETLIPWIESLAAADCRIVMTFVTLEQFTEAVTRLRERYGAEAIEIFNHQLQQAKPLGSFTYFAPQNPTWMIHYTLKESSNE